MVVEESIPAARSTSRLGESRQESRAKTLNTERLPDRYVWLE